jgi:hypothetical protein
MEQSWWGLVSTFPAIVSYEENDYACWEVGEVPQGFTGSLRRGFHIVCEADKAECLQFEIPGWLTRTSSSAFFKAAICEILSEEGSDNRGLSGFSSQKFMVSMNVSGSTRARDVEYGLMRLKEGGYGKVWP